MPKKYNLLPINVQKLFRLSYYNFFPVEMGYFNEEITRLDFYSNAARSEQMIFETLQFICKDFILYMLRNQSRHIFYPLQFCILLPGTYSMKHY